MRFTLPPIVVPLVVAGISGAFVPVESWAEWRAGLLPAVSVIAAAVLVRLARGVPFTNPDQFDPIEVVQVTDAIRHLARSLRSLIFVILGSMVGLVLVQPVSDFLAGCVSHKLAFWLAKGLSALLGLCLGYVFIRMIQVVQSDISLVDRQARMLTNSVRLKNAKAFDENVVKKARSIPKPAGYGEPLH